MKLCVYTCMTGNYDSLEEIREPERGVDYYCFTNNKNLKSKTWKIIQIKDDPLDNCRLARKTKIIGNPILEKYDIAVWTDANIIWQKPISEFVKKYHKPGCFSISKHHCRTTVSEEAAACLIENKDTKDSLLATLNYLNDNNFSDNIGLYESTVFIREPLDKTTQEACRVWFDIISSYSKRDQLSFPYAAQSTKLPINALDINIWNNQWFTYKNHCSSNLFSFRRFYFGDLNSKFDFNLYCSESNPTTSSPFTIKIKVPKTTDCIEFIPTATIGTTISGFEVKNKLSSIEKFGFLQIGSDLVTCARRSTLKLHGHFKKNEILIINLALSIPEIDSLSLLTEKLWAKEGEAKDKLSMLENENKNLKMSLDKIHSTAIWKIWKILKRPLARFHKYPQK